MAQSAAVLTEETPLPIAESANPDELQAPPPRRGGRQKGQYSSNRFGSTRNGESDEQESFWDYLSGLSTVDWESHMLYVYMWDPIVDLTKGGREAKYRKRYTSAVNEESLKREVGSGTYNLKLNRLDQQTRKERTIRELVVNIFDPDYPPNLPPGGWLDDPRNKEWAWAKPILEKRWATPAPTAPATEGVPPYMVQFMTEVRSELGRRQDLNPGAKDQLMNSVVTILPQLLQQQNTANDPTKLFDVMAKIMEMIRPPAAPAQDNTLLTFVLNQLGEVQKQNGELMRMMLAEKKQEANPLNQVETMVKLVSAVAGIAQPAAPKEPWVEFAETIAPQALPVLDKFATGLVMMNTRPNPAQRPQPQPIPQAQPVAQQPAPQVIPVQSQPVPPAQPEQPAQPEMDTMERSMIIQIATLSAQALNLGMMGDQFADQICTRIFNDRIYDEFCQQVPKDQIIGKFKQVPEAWALLQAHEGVLQSFIDSFYDYGAEEQVEETKSISPEQPVKPKKAKKSK